MSAIVSNANGIGSTLAAISANAAGWFVPMLLATLFYFHYDAIVSPEWRPIIDVPSDQLLDEYDFIIVGGGSAGYY